MKVILAKWRIEANGIISSSARIALYVIEKPWSSARSSILGFWLILQNEIVAYILCHGRVCDGIRPESLSKFGADIFDSKPFQVEKYDNSRPIHPA
jgi:hypothetical protein